MKSLQLSIQFKPLLLFISQLFLFHNIYGTSTPQRAALPGEQIFRKLRRKGQGQATRSACQQSAQHLCISRFEANMPWNESWIGFVWTNYGDLSRGMAPAVNARESPPESSLDLGFGWFRKVVSQELVRALIVRARKNIGFRI